jgi:hypothetical protein
MAMFKVAFATDLTGAEKFAQLCRYICGQYTSVQDLKSN